MLKKLYALGHANKEDYAAALHGYQAAVDATESSPERELGEAVLLMVVKGSPARIN